MTDRPILFSGPMVRALLAGTKTQTRRLATSPLRKVEVGDRLWVRETYACHWATDDQKPSEIDPALWSVRYLADDHIRPAARDGSLALLDQCKMRRPGIFMPRWASRLTLTATDKRFEPLRSIAGNDPRCEGVERAGQDWKDYSGRFPAMLSARESFQTLWESLHDKPGERWSDNPEIVALTFTVERRNIDG